MISRFFGTMTVRIFMIVIVGVLVTASIIIFINQHDRRNDEAKIRNQFTKERIDNIVKIMDNTDHDKRSEILDVWQRMGVRIILTEKVPAEPEALTPELSSLRSILAPEVIKYMKLQSSSKCLFQDFRNRHSDDACLAVYAQLRDGSNIQLNLSYNKPPPHIKIKKNLGITLAFILIALAFVTYMIANIATKPLRKLADAAQALKDNIESMPLSEEDGSIEVRHAAKAFNEMQTSIRHHIAERSFMLGAIAHDLQTPLTRLRLRLEKVSDVSLKQSLIEDLTATLDMIHEALDFANISSTNIVKQNIDLKSFIQAIEDDAKDAGYPFKAIIQINASIMASANLLKRCINNLLENAYRYGKNTTLTLQEDVRYIFITISDDGPGIPEDELLNILEPFARLEESRSRYTGGTGLGLSIARMIVEKHQGKLTLKNKTYPNTGLIAEIQLPKSS